MQDKDRKIAVDENGKRYVRWVTRAFLEWAKDMDLAEVGRLAKYIEERTDAGDEEALKQFPFLATREHMDAWQEGFSVSDKEQ